LTDEHVFGLSFELRFDPVALEYVSVSRGWASVNDPGVLSGVYSQATLIPLGTLLEITFKVNGPSTLALQNVVGSRQGTEGPEDFFPETTDGEILVGETTVIYEAVWTPPPASFGVVRTLVFVGESVDPNDGTFAEVAVATYPWTVDPQDPQKVVSPQFEVPSNVGTRYAYAVHQDAEDDLGPVMVPVPFSTDQALPSVEGFSIRVV
jgi:hypothetical protein